MKCKKAKKLTVPGEKPPTVKTHLRNCIVMPEMVGNVVGVYSGRTFNPV
jgi:small subunit ribosomal protein S15e